MQQSTAERSETDCNKQPEGRGRRASSKHQKLAAGEPSTKHQEQGTSHENEVLVRVNGVSKKFCRDLKKSLWYGVKDVASELLPFAKGHQQSTINNHQSSIINHQSLPNPRQRRILIQNSKFKTCPSKPRRSWIQNFHRPASGLVNFGR